MRKNSFRLMLLGALLVAISVCNNANAYEITSFPESNFWIVDSTLGTRPYSTHGSYHDSIRTEFPEVILSNPNAYQLTDTFNLQTVAMWNKVKIDLNKDFLLNVRLFFDTGKAQTNWIADGICFVLHTKDDTSLIGGGAQYLGYGYTYSVSVPPDNILSSPVVIYPSFAVAFDTEYNANEEGAAIANCNSNSQCHISYLKNGNLRVLPGTSVPMQDNCGTVGTGQWYCVSIWWDKTTDENGDTCFDMKTYMAQRYYTYEENVPGKIWHETWPPALRNTKRFYNLSDLITGLQPNSIGEAWATWGITSSTCLEANRHQIQFIKLTNKEDATTPIQTIDGAITISWEGGETSYYGYDRVLRTACGDIPVSTASAIPDTISPSMFCGNENPIIQISGGVGYWSILTDTGYVSIDTSSTFAMYQHRDTAANRDSVWVRMISGTDTTYFNFRFTPKESKRKETLLN
jgi:hypothetical protein